LQQAQAAQTDAASALPAVPVWADEIRLARGEPVAESPVVAPAVNDTEHAARRQQATQAVGDALARVAKELEQGHTKALHKCVTDLRHALKEHGRWLSAELDAQAQALLAQAGDLEGWQKWRADQLRTELVAKAEQLTQGPEGQRLGGRKMQETLRALRDQWKQTDQGGAPNHALWKRFDEACTQAHKGVEAWLDKVRADAAQHRAQRLALLQSLKDWAGAHATQTDWKQQLRALHDFGEQWRNAGHLSEKQFAELQPLWKEAWAAARAPLDAAQAQSLELRKALIAQAQALGAAPVFRLDAVKALQHEWQAEAQRVPLDRKQEQKLWDAFRKPIDEAFERKSAEREKQASALSRHDQQVLAAAKALQEANASQDAQRIQSAMSALAAALRGESAGENEQKTLSAQEHQENNAPESGVKADPEEAVAQPAVRKPVVAVRGDDRPGMKKAEPAAPVRNGRAAPDGRERGPARRDGPPQRDQAPRFAERAPRLGDAAFRAQRDALEQAQTALKKLAAQAHGQTLTQLLDAWKARDAQQLPSVQELGGRLGAAQRATWAQALSMPAQGVADTSLLRLEMAAELPTPASHLDARRALQLQLLTRRNDPIPAQTWVQDAAQVLASPWGAEQAQRLQATLKSLIRRG
jgi:hypothetical protein